MQKSKVIEKKQERIEFEGEGQEKVETYDWWGQRRSILEGIATAVPEVPNFSQEVPDDQGNYSEGGSEARHHRKGRSQQYFQSGKGTTRYGVWLCAKELAEPEALPGDWLNQELSLNIYTRRLYIILWAILIEPKYIFCRFLIILL